MGTKKRYAIFFQNSDGTENHIAPLLKKEPRSEKERRSIFGDVMMKWKNKLEKLFPDLYLEDIWDSSRTRVRARKGVDLRRSRRRLGEHGFDVLNRLEKAEEQIQAEKL